MTDIADPPDPTAISPIPPHGDLLIDRTLTEADSRDLHALAAGLPSLTLQPRELNDLYGDEAHAKAQAHLTIHLVNDLYGGDEEWVKDGQLIGLPDQEWSPRPNRNLSGVRGSHYPTPPQLDADKPVGMP